MHCDEQEEKDARIVRGVYRALTAAASDHEASPELAEALARCADRVLVRLEGWDSDPAVAS